MERKSNIDWFALLVVHMLMKKQSGIMVIVVEVMDITQDTLTKRYFARSWETILMDTFQSQFDDSSHDAISLETIIPKFERDSVLNECRYVCCYPSARPHNSYDWKIVEKMLW